MNVADALDAALAQAPGQTAIFFEGHAISYRELDRRASRLAHFLERSGIANGDRVALFLPNIPEFATAYYAAQKLGAVAVSLNSMLKTAELEYALADSEARVLFTTEALLGEVVGARPRLPLLERVIVCEGHDRAPATLTLEDAMAGCSDSFPARPCAASDPAAILYTSGTTGKPKGAVLTHGNLVSNSLATVRCVGSRPGDRHLLYLPLFHCFGQNFIMNAAFRSLGSVVLERRYHLETTLADIQRYEVSHFYGVPTIFIYLLDARLAPAQLASVRFFFSAAATMPREIAETWRERFQQPIYEGYGLTETSPLASYNHVGSYRLGSVGTPIDDVELKIIDERGQERGSDEWGEICIKGPNVMAGYFRREQETAETVRDGWFHTGDIGYRDRDGYYYLVDRVKDMINCAGFKVWPREVEEVLYQHDDVAECAVVGKPHPVKGERVVAYVRLEPGAVADAAALHRHCESQLARYKLPDEYILDRPIPKSPAGKILKRVLRD
jgi:long-chain acyl-CoA synthetase